MRPLQVVLLFACSCSAPVSAIDGGGFDAGEFDAGWVSLFNGVDFSGWRRYLGKPTPNDAPLGYDTDPREVFSVTMVDGEPALHITGEIWGCLLSEASYGDFELEAQFKWGTRVWPPLNFFDSGLMYLSHGPAGAVNAGGAALSDPIGSGAFFVSMEYQLAPNDVGTLYNLGPIRYSGAPRFPNVTENAGWNDVRIELSDGGVRHFLNGQLVTTGGTFISAWPGQPEVELNRGQLQLQSEGGEIYFRRLRIRPLP